MKTSDNPKGPLSEINVVPLVDIMLVLLIIFMITAPMMQYGLHIDVPKVSSRPLPSKEEPQILSITKDQKLILNEKQVSLDDLKAAIKLLFANKADKSIYVKADRDIPYGFVVMCLSAIREAGIEKINIVTKPLEVK